MRSVASGVVWVAGSLVDELVEEDPVHDTPADDGAVAVNGFDEVDVMAKFRRDVSDGDAKEVG